MELAETAKADDSAPKDASWAPEDSNPTGGGDPPPGEPNGTAHSPPPSTEVEETEPTGPAALNHDRFEDVVTDAVGGRPPPPPDLDQPDLDQLGELMGESSDALDGRSSSDGRRSSLVHRFLDYMGGGHADARKGLSNYKNHREKRSASDAVLEDRRYQLSDQQIDSIRKGKPVFDRAVSEAEGLHATEQFEVLQEIQKSGDEFKSRGRGGGGALDPYDLGDGERRRSHFMESLRKHVNDGLRVITGRSLDLELPEWPSREFQDPQGVVRRRGMLARTHLVLSDPASSSKGMKWSLFVMLLIVVSCTCMVLETVPNIQQWPDKCLSEGRAVCDRVNQENETLVDERREWGAFCRRENCEKEPHAYFLWVEFGAVVIFTLEYLARVLTAWSTQDYIEQYRTDVTRTYYLHAGTVRRWVLRELNFLLDFMNMIDLLAILPFWLTRMGLISAKVTFVRLLRLAKVLRILRLKALPGVAAKIQEGLLMIVQAFNRSSLSLGILCMCTFFLMILMASLVFTFEEGEMDYDTGMYMVSDPLGDHLPMLESKFSSIPRSFWWTLVTLTTVGYGDVVPLTYMGGVIAVVTMYLGLMFVAMPISIIGGHYSEMYLKSAETNRTQAVRRKKAASLLTKHIMGHYHYDGVESCMTLFRTWRNYVKDLVKQEEVSMTKVVKALQEETAQIKEQLDPIKAQLNTIIAHLESLKK